MGKFTQKEMYCIVWGGEEEWFGRKGVFNHSKDKIWISTTEKIEFSEKRSTNWMTYVDERRMEITCGEAPYLVSRYNATTGKIIPLKQRIGLLERKIRVVKENSNNETDWLKWSKHAFLNLFMVFNIKEIVFFCQ
ncbi:hypothetical protein HMPREF1580_01355 [Gardnerella vaginalis JCP8070]|nr:hypothetical protein HMPREF1580_01355 [Gardnerella vaginalis JCP8070]